MNCTNFSYDKLSETELIELIGGNDVEKALAATSSAAATPIVLRFSILDGDKRVRLAALQNKNISDDLVLLLCSDQSSEIALEAKAKAESRGLL